MKTNTPQVAVHVGLVTGGSPGDKPKEFLDLGTLFDGHIERKLSDNRFTGIVIQTSRCDGPVCAYHSSAPGVARTSFHRFRRTILEGTYFLGARALELGDFVAPQKTRKALPQGSARGERLLCGHGLLQHNRLPSRSAGALHRDLAAL
jgi:hypothetical protein